MYLKAIQRFKWCRISGDTLLIGSRSNKRLPYDSSIFDVVYMESVLGILSMEDMFFMIGEINRVLKTGGTFAINETFWIADIPNEIRTEINTEAIKAFGIPQAAAYIESAGDFISKVEDMNFTTEYHSDINVIPV